MILDSLKNASRYYALHPAFERAFDFLVKNAAVSLAPGRVDIDGDVLYALVSDSEGKGQRKAKLEAHRKYIDIQYVVYGTEIIGWKPLEACRGQEKPYDVTGDIVFFSDEPCSWCSIPQGNLAVFFPEDAHAPLAGNGPVRKIVIKVAV